MPFLAAFIKDVHRPRFTELRSAISARGTDNQGATCNRPSGAKGCIPTRIRCKENLRLFPFESNSFKYIGSACLWFWSIFPRRANHNCIIVNDSSSKMINRPTSRGGQSLLKGPGCACTLIDYRGSCSPFMCTNYQHIILDGCSAETDIPHIWLWGRLGQDRGKQELFTVTNSHMAIPRGGIVASGDIQQDKADNEVRGASAEIYHHATTNCH